MTSAEYKSFIEQIRSIDILADINDLDPNWEPLTIEEIRSKKLEKIEADVAKGKLSQEAFNLWKNSATGELTDEQQQLLHQVDYEIFIEDHPEWEALATKLFTAMNSNDKVVFIYGDEE